MQMKIGCILMAAGTGSRFGGSKLQSAYAGKPLYEHALLCIPKEEFAGVAVVAQQDEILAAARAQGFTAVYNPHPEDGVSRTIALGMDALPGMDALLFLVADQPLLTRQSVVGELSFYRAHPKNIVAMGYGERRGNPAIFPKEFFAELRALTGDAGGSAVIRAHMEALLLFQLSDPMELMDVDTPGEWQSLCAELSPNEEMEVPHESREGL